SWTKSPTNLVLNSTRCWTSWTVTKRKPSLKSALTGLLGRDDCFIAGTKIEECGKTFSIRPQAGEEVVGIRVDGCQLTAQSGLACDAVFFIHRPSQNHLLIVLVELKGSDVGHAVKQITAVRDYLAHLVGCGQGRRHGQALLTAMGSPTGLSHGGNLLGVVVSRSGLPQMQQLAAAARKAGVKLTKQKDTTGISTSQLVTWLGI
ncbi:MAG: hypothetical protein V1797_01700, partial [Pseudomonadota bacterium]